MIRRRSGSRANCEIPFGSCFGDDNHGEAAGPIRLQRIGAQRFSDIVAPTSGRCPANQAAAFLQHTDKEQLGCHRVIRDLDGKFSSAFHGVFREQQVVINPVGPRAPNLNAFVERWIQSLKHGALNHFVVFGLAHFDHIVSEFVDYYHECRPHQGIGNRLITPPESVQSPVVSLDQLACDERLGGLLKHYYRAA